MDAAHHAVTAEVKVETLATGLVISTPVYQVARGVRAEVASLPDGTETWVEDAFEVLP